jgi:hypothetical protein
MEEEVDWMKVEEENLTEPPALRANAMKFGEYWVWRPCDTLKLGTNFLAQT